MYQETSIHCWIFANFTDFDSIPFRVGPVLVDDCLHSAHWSTGRPAGSSTGARPTSVFVHQQQCKRQKRSECSRCIMNSPTAAPTKFLRPPQLNDGFFWILVIIIIASGVLCVTISLLARLICYILSSRNVLKTFTLSSRKTSKMFVKIYLCLNRRDDLVSSIR